MPGEAAPEAGRHAALLIGATESFFNPVSSNIYTHQYETDRLLRPVVPGLPHRKTLADPEQYRLPGNKHRRDARSRARDRSPDGQASHSAICGEWRVDPAVRSRPRLQVPGDGAAVRRRAISKKIGFAAHAPQLQLSELFFFLFNGTVPAQ